MQTRLIFPRRRHPHNYLQGKGLAKDNAECTETLQGGVPSILWFCCFPANVQLYNCTLQWSGCDFDWSHPILVKAFQGHFLGRTTGLAHHQSPSSASQCPSASDVRPEAKRLGCRHAQASQKIIGTTSQRTCLCVWTAKAKQAKNKTKHTNNGGTWRQSTHVQSFRSSKAKPLPIVEWLVPRPSHPGLLEGWRPGTRWPGFSSSKISNTWKRLASLGWSIVCTVSLWVACHLDAWTWRNILKNCRKYQGKRCCVQPILTNCILILIKQDRRPPPSPPIPP